MPFTKKQPLPPVYWRQ